MAVKLFEMKRLILRSVKAAVSASHSTVGVGLDLPIEGGGIFVDPESGVVITDSTVAENEADAGGGMFLSYASHTTITRTTVSTNSSGGDGGGIWATFGAPTEGEPHPVVDLDHSAIVNNTAAQDGGGIFNFNPRFFHLQGGTGICLNTPGP
jgi:hypothetical protein